MGRSKRRRRSMSSQYVFPSAPDDVATYPDMVRVPQTPPSVATPSQTTPQHHSPISLATVVNEQLRVRGVDDRIATMSVAELEEQLAQIDREMGSIALDRQLIGLRSQLS